MTCVFFAEYDDELEAYRTTQAPGPDFEESPHEGREYVYKMLAR